MEGSHITLWDPHLGRDVHLWSFGFFGPPVIVFPSAAGFAHEWKAQGMIEALAPLLHAGRLKLYCPESNVSQSWTQKDGPPQERLRRHADYEHFVMRTLVPHVRADCRHPSIPIATAGCSLGASYAAMFSLKHPETFSRALCFSGRYWMSPFMNHATSPELYFNDPMSFVPRLEGKELERLRQQVMVTLVCGQGPWEEGCIEETRALAEWLRRKKIPVREDIWGHDVSHGWEWWRRQARMHFEHAF